MKGSIMSLPIVVRKQNDNVFVLVHRAKKVLEDNNVDKSVILKMMTDVVNASSISEIEQIVKSHCQIQIES